MEKAIIGKKIGMTQIFDEAGHAVPVTVIEAGPCTVVQKKTAEKDGYEAVQLGFQTIPERKLTKPEAGHQKKAGITEFQKVLKEFALKDSEKYNVGDKVTADTFAAGDFVDVTGISKGHGYQGVIKRHGAHRLKETHGSGPVVRHAGSMGANSSPSKIFKGKIGAGQMGDEQVTVQNLDVVKVDPEYNLIAVRGAIPGPKGGIVFAPKPRSYSYALNKKVKRLALKSALSAKAASGDIKVVDGLKLDEIKTKTMRGFLAGIGAGKSVVITPEVDEIVVKSARNIPGVVTTTAKVLSVYDIVNANQLVIDKAALAIIEEVFA